MIQLFAKGRFVIALYHLCKRKKIYKRYEVKKMTKEEFANLEIKVSISDFINVLSLVDHLAYSCNADALRDALQISTDIKLKAVSLIEIISMSNKRNSF